jgi:hypothetical protein
MCHTSRSSFILGIFYEGKIEETGKQPKRSEPIQVKLKFYKNQRTMGRQIQKLVLNN